VSRYDLEVWKVLHEAGWAEVTPIPDHGRVFCRDGTHTLLLEYLDTSLRRWPWMREALLRALLRGAVGWQITKLDEKGGGLTLTFQPEWPDAVTALGRVSADEATPC